MKRVIVDFKKLTPEIFNLLVEKFPDGYGLRDVIRFTNNQGQYIEAVEVRTDDTTYLVKISDQLAYSMENYEEEEPVDPDIESEVDFGEIELDEDLEEDL